MSLHTARVVHSYSRDRSVTDRRVSRATLRRIAAFARPYRRQLSVFLVLIAVDAAVGAVTPLLFRRLIDQGIAAHRRDVVLTSAAAAAGLALASAALAIAQRWLSARVGEGLIVDLRTAVFDHVQRLSLAFFSRSRTGALVQRINGDVLGAQQAFTSTLSTVVSNGLTVIFVLAAMASMSWQLTLAALALTPLFVLPARWVGPRLAAATREGYALNADAAQHMNERFNVAGAHLVKLFGVPAQESAAFARTAERVRDIGVRQAMYGTVFRVGLTTLASIGVAIVYGAGGLMAVQGTLTVGVVVALASYLSRLYGPLTAMSNVQVDVMTALVSFERVFEILDLPPTVTDAPGAHDLRADVEARGASLELDHVGFCYPGPDGGAPGSGTVSPTLTDVTFRVPAGAMVALVGPSGAGKTTISHLVTRMYDPADGAVRIAGTDLRDVTLESLRTTVGVVTQEAHLFHDTIAGNLRYARPEASDAELESALCRARIWDLVASLPEGVHTVVGDRGYRLSGGERQRIAIARLLLRAPALVVLDEATAHLDSASELAVQHALDEALVGRTSLVIAHRLSTVRAADLIVVVDQGRVVEQGTHDELVAAGGLYARLHRDQTTGRARPS